MSTTSPGSDLHGFGEVIRGELSEHIPRDESLDVLDVGTGFGISIEFLARRLSKRSVIWTVDPSREVLARAKEATDKSLAGRLRFAVASAEKLAFEDESFDIVVSVMVLHHIEKLQPALAEMARVLKP